MLPKEMIQKIRKIEIQSNQLVEEVFSGKYHSLFKGNGLEFQDIREYAFGDDIRSIDWKVTAKYSKPYIKQYNEERELNLFLLIDMSSSTFFGRKKEFISEIAATLAFSAVKNNDKVGAVIFTDKVEKLIPSKKGKKHALSIIASILNTEPQSKKTDIQEVLRFFKTFEKKRSIVFLISDFFDKDYEKEAAVTAQKHDLILIRVMEKAEQKLPKGAIFSFQDMETGEEIVLDNLKNEIPLKLDLKFKNFIEIETEQDFVKPLSIFFKRRRRK